MSDNDQGDNSNNGNNDSAAAERRKVAAILLGDMGRDDERPGGLHPKDLVLGSHEATIIDFRVEREPVEDPRLLALWTYRFMGGQMNGRTYVRYQTITLNSRYRFYRALMLVSQQRTFKDADLYDAGADDAGRIKGKVVGARVRVSVERTAVGDRVYTNVDPVALLEPATGA